MIGCKNKHVKTPSQLLSACSSLKGYMVVGAKAYTTHNQNTSRVFYIIKSKQQQNIPAYTCLSQCLCECASLRS